MADGTAELKTFVFRCEMLKTVDVFIEAASEEEAQAKYSEYDWVDEQDVDTIETSKARLDRVIE